MTYYLKALDYSELYISKRIVNALLKHDQMWTAYLDSAVDGKYNISVVSDEKGPVIFRDADFTYEEIYDRFPFEKRECK